MEKLLKKMEIAGPILHAIQPEKAAQKLALMVKELGSNPEATLNVKAGDLMIVLIALQHCSDLATLSIKELKELYGDDFKGLYPITPKGDA